MKILVSSCLLGDNTKYNGMSNKNDELIKFLKNYEVIKVCPEVMGGLSIPRDPSEIVDGRILTNKGIDVTSYFQSGAKKVLDIVQKEKIKVAIFKKNSPSCGYKTIYDGSFNNKKIKGNGITAALLEQHGIIILNEDNYRDYFK